MITFKWSDIDTHIGEIIKYDTANGPGVRLSIFLSGCTRKCPGCFQPQTWDIEYGKHIDQNLFDDMMTELSKDYYQGITILGGEPLGYWNLLFLTHLLSYMKNDDKLKNKDVWMYTGYTWEELLEIAKKDSMDGGEVGHAILLDNILSMVDVLVDGPFVEEKKNPMLKFRGSSNQRLIKCSESICNDKKIILLEE